MADNNSSHLDAADINSKQPKSWREQIKVHPAADKSPMMKPDKLKVVGEDIKKNGLHIPVAVFKEQKHFQPELLAGRNRLDAMEAVGITIRVEHNGTDSDPRVELWARWPNDTMERPIKTTELRGDHGVDPSEYVISENIHRNHFTVAEQRDVIARLLQAHPDKSDRQIAEMAKDEHKKVGRVRADLETRGAMPHVEKRTDTKGRKQQAHKPPAKKKRRDVDDYLAEKKARTAATKDADAPRLAPQQIDLEQCIDEHDAVAAKPDKDGDTAALIARIINKHGGLMDNFIRSAVVAFSKEVVAASFTSTDGVCLYDREAWLECARTCLEHMSDETNDDENDEAAPPVGDELDIPASLKRT